MLIFFSGCLEVLGIGIILPYLTILLEPQKVISIHEINIVYTWLNNIGIVSDVRHFLILSTFSSSSNNSVTCTIPNSL